MSCRLSHECLDFSEAAYPSSTANAKVERCALKWCFNAQVRLLACHIDPKRSSVGCMHELRTCYGILQSLILEAINIERLTLQKSFLVSAVPPPATELA